MLETITFTHQGVTLAGTLYMPDNATKAVPATVSAAGFGGVKEMLLPSFAEALARAGIATLIFDYAGFGASAGEPRQHVSPTAQVEQIKTALDWLAAHPRVDANRLGIWGPSMAGGHTLVVAATDARIRCAVALIPFTSVSAEPPNRALLEALMADAQARERGEPGQLIPCVGKPGELAVMTSDGAWEWFERMGATSPNMRNAVTLASLIEVAGYRPADVAAQIKAPLRVILAADDTITPSGPARAALSGVPVVDFLEFPETHFELFEKHAAAVIDATVSWFSRHLMA
jgi:dienelactone hydrolase